MTYQDFVASAANQQRYWARAHVGWSRMGGAEPNTGHHLLAAMAPELVITQNVDGLHARAGQDPLVELHGRVSEVVCLDCRRVWPRSQVQTAMAAANPGYAHTHGDVTARPDGDVELEDTHDFVVPTCSACDGRLKPHVVFFGENVPRDRVDRCVAAVAATQALLVLGSSLTVMSGFRFVRQAYRAGLPIVIVNRGATRGDDLATVKLEMGCSEFLAAQSERSRIVEGSAASFSTVDSASDDSTSITA